MTRRKKEKRGARSEQAQWFPALPVCVLVGSALLLLVFGWNLLRVFGRSELLSRQNLALRDLRRESESWTAVRSANLLRYMETRDRRWVENRASALRELGSAVPEALLHLPAGAREEPEERVASAIRAVNGVEEAALALGEKQGRWGEARQLLSGGEYLRLRRELAQRLAEVFRAAEEGLAQTRSRLHAAWFHASWSALAGVLCIFGGWTAALRNGARWRAIAVHNMNGRLKAEATLRLTEQRYSLAMLGSNDGIWDWNLEDNFVYFSPRWAGMLGWSEGEIGSDLSEWLGRIHPEDESAVRTQLGSYLSGEISHFENEHRVQHKDGSWRWVLVRGAAVRNSSGRALRMAGSLTDITVRRQAEETLRQGAHYDALTGLPNRIYFTGHVARALGRHKRHPDRLFAVLFLDLDRFKHINDTYGHAAGDAVLITIAGRLSSILRPGDVAARLGGDEFTVLLDDLETPDDAVQVAGRIQKEVSIRFRELGPDAYTTASIGIAFSLPHYDTAEEMLHDADEAMYAAKAAGKACSRIFQPRQASQPS